MRDDDYLQFDFTDMPAPFPTDRREFLKIVGGGIFVLVSFGEAEILAQRRGRGFGRQLPSDFNAFLKIGEDGRVSCFTGFKAPLRAREEAWLWYR